MWNWAFSKKVFSRAKLLFYYCFFDVLVAVTIVIAQAWFSYVLKIPDDQGFHFLPTVSEFADVSDNNLPEVCPRFIWCWIWWEMESAPKIEICEQMCDRETEAQQFRELVMSKIHCQRPWRYKFEFSFVENDRWPWSQKSAMRGEHRNTPDSPDLSPSIPDDWGYPRFWVFISRQNLGQSGNNKIPDRLGFSRHMKTRLQVPPCSLLLR